MTKPFVSRADESPAYWQLGHLWQIMATGVQTDNTFTLLDQVVHNGVGGGPVTHTHAQDEGLYVISGKCTFNAGGHHGMAAPAGTFVAVPKYTEHCFTIDEPNTHLLNFYLPAGFEQIIMGISLPARERAPPPADKVQEMMAPRWIVDKLNDDYGIENTLGNPFATKPTSEKVITRPLIGATEFPYTISASQAKSLNAYGITWTILADSKATGGSYTLMEMRKSSGDIIGRHVFEDIVQVFYIFRGELKVRFDGKQYILHKGDLAFAPAGTIVEIDHLGDDLHALHLTSKSGFEGLLHAKAAPVASAAGQLAIEKRIAEKLGLKFF